MSIAWDIRTKSLYKKYELPFLSGWKRKWLGSQRHQVGWALEDITFQLERGETLGVIGPNGSGKSTLLKALAQIIPLTRGEIQIAGRLHAMIELNAGLRPQLSGRENVYLLAALKGLFFREIRQMMPAIEDFCALGSNFDKPVRQYSSGMAARIGVAVAAHIPANIILLDEALAVGDLEFEQKCLHRLDQIRQSGDVSMLIVSHNLNQVRRLCSRTLLLGGGKMVAIGDTDSTIESYYNLCRNSGEPYLSTYSGEPKLWSVLPGVPRIERASFVLLNGKEQQTTVAITGEPLVLKLQCDLPSDLRALPLSFEISFSKPENAFFTSTLSPTKSFENCDDGEIALLCRINNLPLMEGIYHLNLRISGPAGQLYYAQKNVHTLKVQGRSRQQLSDNHCYFTLDAQWSL